MTTLAIEIHDAGLLAVSEDGALGEPSPGVALVDGGAISTGRAAVGRAREKPRRTHHRFWQDLDTRPLGRPFPRDLSAADLAHAHLSEVWDGAKGGVENVLLAVSGAFTDAQLGLLAGIAQACAVPVAGLVDAAVAAATAADAPASPRTLHLDLHLHRAVLTELAVSQPPAPAAPATAVRRRLQLADGVGLIGLQDVWARRIAELFVHATRYDPLHSAAAEQALYDALPGWLEGLHREEILELTLGPAGKERSIELTRPDVVAAADAFYDRLLDLVSAAKRTGEDVTLLLAHHAALLPGLEPRLATLRGVEIVRLAADAAGAGALAARQQILERSPGDAGAGDAPLPFVTRLSFEPPAREPAEAAPERTPDAGTPTPTARTPTHLVHDGLAYPIREPSFAVGSAIGDEPGLRLDGPANEVSPLHCRVVRRRGRVTVENHGTAGSFLNGSPVTGPARAEAGDRLRLGRAGAELTFVAVVDPEE